MSKKSNRGGKRPGAGPPQIPEDEKKQNVALYLEQGLIIEYGEKFCDNFDGTFKMAHKKVQQDLKEFFYNSLTLVELKATS